MAKYLMIWELDASKIPIGREDRAAAWTPMVAMVEQGIKDGYIKDWGIFVGESRGYSIAEGTEAEIALFNQQWVPFVDFKVHPVATIKDIRKVIEGLSK
jgi:hypothetical protein